MTDNPTIWFGGKRPELQDFVPVTSGANLHYHLGIEVSGIGDDYLQLRMPVDHRTHQPFGRLHGGASVALAESAASMAANWCIDSARFVAVGQEINANHIRPAFDGWVIATARPEAIGRTSHVWTIRIEDEAGRLICISRFTAAIIALERR